MNPRSKYDLFSGCNLSKEEKNARSMVGYQLEIVNKGFRQLSNKLIDEKEFFTLIKKSGLSRQVFEELTSSPMGDMFLDSSLTAYLRAKNIQEKDDVEVPADK